MSFVTSVRLSIRPSVRLYIRPSVCISVRPSVYPSVRLYILRPSVRPSSCTSWSATGKISVKFVFGDFCENLSREKKSVIKEGPKFRALYMMLIKCTLKFLSRRKKMYIIYIVHIYNITLYVKYV